MITANTMEEWVNIYSPTNITQAKGVWLIILTANGFRHRNVFNNRDIIAKVSKPKSRTDMVIPCL